MELIGAGDEDAALRTNAITRRAAERITWCHGSAGSATSDHSRIRHAAEIRCRGTGIAGSGNAGAFRLIAIPGPCDEPYFEFTVVFHFPTLPGIFRRRLRLQGRGAADAIVMRRAAGKRTGTIGRCRGGAAGSIALDRAACCHTAGIGSGCAGLAEIGRGRGDATDAAALDRAAAVAHLPVIGFVMQIRRARSGDGETSHITERRGVEIVVFRGLSRQSVPRLRRIRSQGDDRKQ